MVGTKVVDVELLIVGITQRSYIISHNIGNYGGYWQSYALIS